MDSNISQKLLLFGRVICKPLKSERERERERERRKKMGRLVRYATFGGARDYVNISGFEGF
jgi:hypothetical protein